MVHGKTAKELHLLVIRAGLRPGGGDAGGIGSGGMRDRAGGRFADAELGVTAGDRAGGELCRDPLDRGEDLSLGGRAMGIRKRAEHK